MTAAPALSAAGLYKAFGSTQALRGANLDLEAGRIRALLGENGSGKSTLAKIISGAQAADQLAKYPDADYIYAVAGIFAVGAAQQAKRMNSHAKVVTGTLTRRTISLLKDGQIQVVVSEPPVVFGRAALQYTVRLLNGDQLPHTIPGIMPFPVAMVPNFSLTPANIGSYDVNKYDLPPEGWTPPQLQ